jgi:cytoskeletal protein RodZ
MLNKLGEELKEARLNMGATLQQMSTRTRIDIKFLEALENGNFSFLPELYVKAFLKEYCAFVELDPAVILKKYELAKQGKSFEEPPPAETKQEIKTEVEKEETKPAHRINTPLPAFDAVQHEPVSESSSSAPNRQKILLASVVGGTIVVIAAVYFLFFNKNSEIIVPEKSYEEVVEQQDKFYENETGAAAVADTSSAVTASADSMRLDIRAADTSWVKILLDDKRSEEFILFPGSRKTITAADNYKITFGRSYAVKLELNGKPLDYKPGKTRVAHVLIDSTGITNLQQAPRFE